MQGFCYVAWRNLLLGKWWTASSSCLQTCYDGLSRIIGELTKYTTLSPCAMCSGAMLLVSPSSYKIDSSTKFPAVWLERTKLLWARSNCWHLEGSKSSLLSTKSVTTSCKPSSIKTPKNGTKISARIKSQSLQSV